ncbi:MAG: thioredoxin domain-containing protein [Limimaricola sp.]|uniref:DsbA family protein n=1 Tax=Limimaricola sp. TaxID=2211665 RepID=UPI001D1EA9DD|nr:DsbA family protein [Limimaricola sp.]MBI1417025.1 thioredoxin domain-containing protein [Limimaricola sp.]
MNRRAFLTASVSVAALGGAWYLTRQGQAEGLLPGPAMADGSAAATAPVADPSLVPDMTLGNPDAKVTVIEYGSFTCPHCAEFHADQWPKIDANYVQTGKIKFIYRELVRNRPDIWASMLARCDGGLRYFGISDLLFKRQQDWAAGGDMASIASGLRQMGKVAGFDDATLEKCLGDATMAQSILSVSQTNADRDGIQGTPTFLINGVKYTNMSYEDFAKILDAQLAG